MTNHKDSKNIKDLKQLYAQGLISAYEYKEKLRLIKNYDFMAKIDDTEREFIKNLITTVLEERLKITRCGDKDAYQFMLCGTLPRDLFLTGKLADIIKRLNSIKHGMAKLIDDAIQELKDRNKGSGF